ncbi:hypothetical protein HYU13_04275 [Candidatus Woesearchaeota archaeon]|nr:hypothetical protein [Candidatus Woesearchaeota archaeon]
MVNEMLVLLIAGILLLVPPATINRIVGIIISIFSGLMLIFAQNAIIDIAGDAAIDAAQELNLVNIPDGFCPASFNRMDYCVEFGLDKGEITGHAFLSDAPSEYVNLRFETKDKLMTCKLTKGVMCNFAEVRSAKDLKISLTDKTGNVVLTLSQLKREVKGISKALGFWKVIKKIKVK